MNKVTISVEGGAVAIEQMPDDMEVEVKDYDVAAYDEDDERLTIDNEGRPYIRRQFSQ